MKIRPVEADLFHSAGQTGGQANMTKLIVIFSQFCEHAQYYYCYFRPG